MAEGLGARVIALEAPFNPEGGAYVKAEDGAEPHPAITTATHHDHASRITIMADAERSRTSRP